MTKSEQPSAIRHLALDGAEHHGALFVGKTERQHFRHERADLARREIDHGENLTADQRFRRIVFGDLRRRFLDADIGWPKSIFSLNAGLRASGNGSASTIVPARMSTRSKSAKLISGFCSLLNSCRTLAQALP